MKSTKIPCLSCKKPASSYPERCFMCRPSKWICAACVDASPKNYPACKEHRRADTSAKAKRHAQKNQGKRRRLMTRLSRSEKNM